MSPGATELPKDATDRQIGEMVDRWNRGEDPPDEPFYATWPEEKETTDT